MSELQDPVLDFGAITSVDFETSSPLGTSCKETSSRYSSPERAVFKVCIISAMTVSDLP